MLHCKTLKDNEKRNLKNHEENCNSIYHFVKLHFLLITKGRELRPSVANEMD